MYFTQDLFGKGAVPTEASLRTWLRNNERPLRQLGLYDEFRDIKNAREAANTAVENAKLGERAAKETAQLAQKEATAAGRLSQKSEQRLAEALQIAAGPTQKPGETLAEALRRTRTGEKAAPIQTFINTRDQQRAASDALTKMRDLVVAAKNPNDVQTAVSNAANTLLQRGVIDDAGYRTMLREVAELKNINEARDRARRVLTYFAGATGLGAGAVTTYVGTR
jgi:tRNA A37 N6-isopentenylltransferase MiaA